MRSALVEGMIVIGHCGGEDFHEPSKLQPQSGSTALWKEYCFFTWDQAVLDTRFFIYSGCFYVTINFKFDKDAKSKKKALKHPDAGA